MTNLEIIAMNELEARSLQIEVVESDYDNEIIAASLEYWEALKQFDEDYPEIYSIIAEYKEYKEEKESSINNSLFRSFMYCGGAAIVGAICPPLAIAGLVGVGLTMFGILNNPNK